MSRLSELERLHPEWAPWLRVVGVLTAELRNSCWTCAGAEAYTGAPSGSDPPTAPPSLLQSQALPGGADVGRLLRLLLAEAAKGDQASRLGQASTRCNDALAVAAFRAGVICDEPTLVRLAASMGVDAALFQALAMLLPVPWLHACRSRLAGAQTSAWRHGYCPCCGAWPALAQVCGIERSRFLSCGRCGSAWQAAALRCPYCGTNDHEALRSLLIEPQAQGVVIEACNACRGYVKSVRKLSVCPPEEVMLEDLASVEFDIVAQQRDYRRPRGVGHALAW